MCCAAVAFIGDYSQRVPDAVAIRAFEALVAYGVLHGYIKANYILYGHRDVQAKSWPSPGDALYSAMQTWPHFGQQDTQRAPMGEKGLGLL